MQVKIFMQFPYSTIGFTVHLAFSSDLEDASVKTGEQQLYLQDTTTRLNNAMYILIAWAALITIAIAVMSAVVGVRVIMLRKRARRLGPRALAPRSECTASFNDNSSVIDFDRMEKKKKAAAAKKPAKAKATAHGSTEWQPRQRTTTSSPEPTSGITIPDPGSSTY